MFTGNLQNFKDSNDRLHYFSEWRERIAEILEICGKIKVVAVQKCSVCEFCRSRKLTTAPTFGIGGVDTA